MILRDCIISHHIDASWFILPIPSYWTVKEVKFPIKTEQKRTILRIPSKDSGNMDFPCEDAYTWRLSMFTKVEALLFSFSSFIQEKCGIRIDNCSKTNAKFTSPNVFLQEKYMRAKGRWLYDLDCKKNLICTKYVDHRKPGDWAKVREAGESDLLSELGSQYSIEQPNSQFGVLTQRMWTLGIESLLADPDGG